MSVTVLDAGVLIGLLNPADAHCEQSRLALKSLVSRRERIVLSAVAYAEAMVGPQRMGRVAAHTADSAIGRIPKLEIADVDRAIARLAARLRANERSLRMPDAIVLATAGRVNADRVLTTDHGLDRFETTRRLSDFVRELDED